MWRVLTIWEELMVGRVVQFTRKVTLPETFSGKTHEISPGIQANVAGFYTDEHSNEAVLLEFDNFGDKNPLTLYEPFSENEMPIRCIRGRITPYQNMRKGTVIKFVNDLPLYRSKDNKEFRVSSGSLAVVVKIEGIFAYLKFITGANIHSGILRMCHKQCPWFYIVIGQDHPIRKIKYSDESHKIVKRIDLKDCEMDFGYPVKRSESSLIGKCSKREETQTEEVDDETLFLLGEFGHPMLDL